MIPPEYDSMIAKVIAHGRDREEALARLHRALSQTIVIVRGGTTNKSFLLDLLERPEVRAGSIDTAWLDRLTAAEAHLPTRHADVALVAAALAAGRADRRARPGVVPRLGQPRPAAAARRSAGEVELRHGGAALRRRVAPARPGRATGRARRHRRRSSTSTPRPRPQPPDDRRPALHRGVLVARQRSPRRGRRRRPPVLARRRRNRPGAGGGAGRRCRRRPRRRRRGRATGSAWSRR